MSMSNTASSAAPPQSRRFIGPKLRRGTLGSGFELRAIWALFGVSAALLEGILRLGQRALLVLKGGLSWPDWLGFALLTGAFVYFEGYRALQCRFAPHVVSRALDATQSRSGLWSWVAPIQVLSLVGDETPAMRRAWLGVAAISLAVVLVRRLPQPWRGLVDGAVALALAWGLAALLVIFWKTAREPR